MSKKWEDCLSCAWFDCDFICGTCTELVDCSLDWLPNRYQASWTNESTLKRIYLQIKGESNE